MGERIHTLHPDGGKKGVNIRREKYDQVREAILSALSERGSLTFEGLFGSVEQRIGSGFEGSLKWYVATVKLDLEARGEIDCDRDRRPQRLQLAGTAV